MGVVNVGVMEHANVGIPTLVNIANSVLEMTSASILLALQTLVVPSVQLSSLRALASEMGICSSPMKPVFSFHRGQGCRSMLHRGAISG